MYACARAPNPRSDLARTAFITVATTPPYPLPPSASPSPFLLRPRVRAPPDRRGKGVEGRGDGGETIINSFPRSCVCCTCRPSRAFPLFFAYVRGCGGARSLILPGARRGNISWCRRGGLFDPIQLSLADGNKDIYTPDPLNRCNKLWCAFAVNVLLSCYPIQFYLIRLQ